MKSKGDKVPDWVTQYRRKEEEFWSRTYPAKSWEEKAQHWVDGIAEMMKASRTSGADPYEGFNPEAYAVWQGQEPRIDEVLGLLEVKLPGFDPVRMWAGIRE